MAWSRAGVESSVRWSRALRLVLATGAAIFSMAAVGCGEDGAPAIGSGSGVGGHPVGDGGVVPCTEGTVESCTVYVGEHNGVLSCYEGVQVCEGGTFGPCKDGRVAPRVS